MEENTAKLRTLKVEIEQQSDTLVTIVDSLVGKYSSELTQLVKLVREQMQSDQEVHLDQLEKWVIELPALMYFAGTGMESLGTESDTAKIKRMAIYNLAHDGASGTVPDKKSAAENATYNEMLIEKAFARAYKKIQRNIIDAEHLFSGIKKVLTNRMEERNIIRRDD